MLEQKHLFEKFIRLKSIEFFDMISDMNCWNNLTIGEEKERCVFLFA